MKHGNPLAGQEPLLLAFAASLLLHLALAALPIHGQLPPTDPARADAPDRVITASLPRRDLADSDSAPDPAVDAATSSHAIVHASPGALTLSRQPELIEDSVDLLIGDANSMAVHGELTMRISLDRRGRPESVRVLRSTMRREVEGAVVLRFFKARYRPGEVNGLPVASEITLSIAIAAIPANPLER